jgi:hypothetical protein
VAGQRHTTAAALHSPGLMEVPHPAVEGFRSLECWRAFWDTVRSVRANALPNLVSRLATSGSHISDDVEICVADGMECECSGDISMSSLGGRPEAVEQRIDHGAELAPHHEPVEQGCEWVGR